MRRHKDRFRSGKMTTHKLMDSPGAIRIYNIFEEEKKRLGIEKEIELSFRVLPNSRDWQEILDYYNSPPGLVLNSEDKSYLILSDTLIMGSEKKVRKVCRHELYHIHKEHNSKLRFLGKFFPTLRNIIFDIPAEKYANS